VKLGLLWIVSGSWGVVLAWIAWTYFQQGLKADVSLLHRPEHLFTGVGALTVGALPLLLTALLHRYQRKRLRGRLLRERDRIERQLQRLEEREGGAEAPTTSAAGS
jgi:hypothetical protein